MFQSDCGETGNGRGSARTAHHNFTKSRPVSSLLSHMKKTEQLSPLFSPLGKARVQDAGVASEQNHAEDGRSVASKTFWDVEKMSMLFSPPGFEEKSPTLSPTDNEAQSAKGDTEPVEEEVQPVTFQSKYIQNFPLYQDYCLRALKDDLNRLSKSLVSELITPLYLQGLQFPRSSASASETPPPKARSAEAAPFSSPSTPIRVTPCALWQDLEEVKASGLLRGLTSRQIHLQECMFEVISSEASYLKSLEVAVNHFYASKALEQTLSHREHHILFSNIRRVMAASEKFFVDLEMHLGERVLMSQVGDIVLRHCPEFHALYVPYVTNMMYQEALLNQLLHQNRHFACLLKKLEHDPVCQRQSLKSFLVLPFQRVTRIKLLLENILKLTDQDSDARSSLEKAIRAVHEIVTDCDNKVRQMKQIEELVCLKALLDFDKVKSIPLVVSRRFLVHQGPMRQKMVGSTSNSKMSFTNIYLHLFNDLLIISLKKDQRFKVVDHAEFPTHVHTENLKTGFLSLPPESFLLRLSRSQTGLPTAMILVAHTKSERETWMKVLSQKH
ncbi:rho guanine nucleotide exchange factor 19 isoform X2 [Betta splendens]|uniref:Rho guanine nucleotide exchange factor 19 isoform X2 n=1 Tax=Betta splendens TaxID=158456 RepID=A0A6P7MMI3_BETSP|nr:rho guanine nucleotide exchange factor 19 isoform X2 [Betta splendens]